MMKDKCLRYLRVDLSESQMFEMGRELARKHNELGGIDAEFDSVKAKFKDRIAGVELTINTLSRLVSNGYDHRDVECKLLWHTPMQAQVTLMRLDTGEEVEVRAMNAQELQETLPFAEEEAKEYEKWVPATETATMTLDTAEKLVAEKCCDHGNFGEEHDCQKQPPSDDELYSDAVKLVKESGKASTSTLQRQFRIGYGRAAQLIDRMEAEGLVVPAEGPGPRQLTDKAKGTGA